MSADQKLLIFDCDGTLVDSEGIANDVFISAVNALGIPLTYEEAWEHFPGTSMAICMDYVEKTYATKLPDDFVANQRIDQKKAFRDRLQPIAGVVNALNLLQSYAKCVASNGPPLILADNLATTKLDHYFGENVFSAYVVESWKPAPDLFLHAAEKMGFRPQNCIVIEDSMAGIQAGMAANMRVLAYHPPHTHYKIEKLDQVTYFDDMNHLVQLVQSS